MYTNENRNEKGAVMNKDGNNAGKVIPRFIIDTGTHAASSGALTQTDGREIQVREGTFTEPDGQLMFEDFVSETAAIVRNRLEADYEITCKRILKNNSVSMDSLTIHGPGEAVSPSIYLNDFYPGYLEGNSLESIADSIIGIYYSGRNAIDFDSIGDFSLEKMKDVIIFKLVNYEMNREQLESTPHIRVEDLAVTFHCLIRTDDIGIGTVRITDEHCSMWGIGIEELKAYALANTPTLLPYTFKNIFDVLAGLVRKEIEGRSDCGEYNEVEEILSRYEDKENSVSEMMYVLTTGEGINGAACLLYPDVLESVRMLIGGPFYILPSSVNEVVIVPDSPDIDEDSLRSMIKQINHEQVPLQEILSDTLYRYPDNRFEI